MNKKIIISSLLLPPVIGGSYFLINNIIKASDEKILTTENGIEYIPMNSSESEFKKIQIKNKKVGQEDLYFHPSEYLTISDEGYSEIAAYLKEEGCPNFNEKNLQLKICYDIYLSSKGEKFAVATTDIHYGRYQYGRGYSVPTELIKKYIEEIREPSYVKGIPVLAADTGGSPYLNMKNLKKIVQPEKFELLVDYYEYYDLPSLEEVEFSDYFLFPAIEYMYFNNPSIKEDFIKKIIEEVDKTDTISYLFNSSSLTPEELKNAAEIRKDMTLKLNGTKYFYGSLSFSKSCFNTLDLSNVSANFYSRFAFGDSFAQHIFGAKNINYMINDIDFLSQDISDWQDEYLKQIFAQSQDTSKYSSQQTQNILLTRADEFFQSGSFPNLETIKTSCRFCNLDSSIESPNLTSVVFTEPAIFINSSSRKKYTEDEFKNIISEDCTNLTFQPVVYANRENITDISNYTELEFIEYNYIYPYTSNGEPETKNISIAKINNGVITKTDDGYVKYTYNPDLIVSVPAKSSLEEYCKKWNYHYTTTPNSCIDVSSAYTISSPIIQSSIDKFQVVNDNKISTCYQFGTDVVQMKNNIYLEGQKIPNTKLQIKLTDLNDNPINFGGTSFAKLKKYLNNSIPASGGVYKVYTTIKDLDENEILDSDDSPKPFIISISSINELPFKINYDGKYTLYKNNNVIDDYINILKLDPNISAESIKVFEENKKPVQVELSIEDNRLKVKGSDIVADKLLFYTNTGEYIGTASIIDSYVYLDSNNFEIGKESGDITFSTSRDINNYSLSINDEPADFCRLEVYNQNIRLVITDKENFINTYGEDCDAVLTLNDFNFDVSVSFDNSKILTFLSDTDVSSIYGTKKELNIYEGSLVLSNEQYQDILDFSKKNNISPTIAYGYLYYIYSQGNKVGISINIDEYITKYKTSMEKWVQHPSYNNIQNEKDPKIWLINHMMSNNYNTTSNKAYKVLYLSEYFS